MTFGPGPAAAQDMGANDIEYLDLRDVPLYEAVRLLSEESGVNIVATQDAMAQYISLFVQNISVEGVIESLCKTHGMWFRKDEVSEVLRIMTLEEYQKDLVVFREEKTKVFTLLHPNAVDVGVAIRDVYGERVVLSLGKETLYDEQLELEQRFNRADLLDERGVFATTGQFGGRGRTGGRFGGGRFGGGYGGYGGYGGIGGGYGGYGGRQEARQGPEFDPVEARTRLQQELTPERAERAALLEEAGA
ncbi:MAG: hypothetical protein ACYTG7_25110, partial [Planctomycetota bacterium]